MPLIRNTDVAKLNGLAPRACELCNRRNNITLCSACKAVYYCGKECQSRDFEIHKTPCKRIEKARLLYESKEKKLCEVVGSPLTRETMFLPLGHPDAFQHILQPREYMRARCEMLYTMLVSYGTAGGRVDVVQMALDHSVDMMHLYPLDPFGRLDPFSLGELIPALYIRLGRDHDAYEFIDTQSYAPIVYRRSHKSKRFLPTNGADVLKAPLAWTSFNIHLSHAVAVMLIKMRVMFDLQAVQNARDALRDAIPQEINDMICGWLVGSVISSRPEILLAGSEETTRLVEKINRQVIRIYSIVKVYNPHFWHLLLEDPDSGDLRRPDRLYDGTKKEALLAVGYNYASWYETPGAVDVIRKLEEGAKAKCRAVQE